MTTRALQFEVLAAGVQYSADLVTTPYVTFFAAGTDTPKNAWDDKDKSSAFTKLALDTQGRGVAYGDGIYKLKFYTGDPDAVAPLTGVLLFTIDNYKCQATSYGVRSLSANGTATPDDDLLICNGTFTVTLEAVSTFERPLTIKNIGTGIIAVTGPQTIDGSAAISITNQYDAITLYPDTAAGAWRRAGDLTADLNASELILDADGDTSITADTDDTIDFKSGGTDQFQITNTQIDLKPGGTSQLTVTGTQIDLKPGGTSQVVVKDGSVEPTTDNDISLGIVDPSNAGKKFSAAAINIVYICNYAAAWNGSAFIAQGKDVTAAIHRKIVEIGDWDMDASNTKAVAHGLTLSKIRTIQIMVRDDAGTTQYSNEAGSLLSVWALSIGATDINLTHSDTGGAGFDSTNFNATSYNRGWVTIDYVD